METFDDWWRQRAERLTVEQRRDGDLKAFVRQAWQHGFDTGWWLRDTPVRTMIETTDVPHPS